MSVKHETKEWRDWNKIQESGLNEQETRDLGKRLEALGSDRRKPKDMEKEDSGNFCVRNVW